MKQYFRRPQDVVGEDRDLLTYWNTMSGKVQLRLLESGLSVSTLGELKMLQEQILFEARLATDATKTSDEYGVEIKDMLDLFGARVEEIRDCIVASVVPPVFNSVRNGARSSSGCWRADCRCPPWGS